MAQRVTYTLVVILVVTIQLAVGLPALAQEWQCTAEESDLGSAILRLVEASRSARYDTFHAGRANQLEDIALWMEQTGAGSLTIAQAARMTGTVKVGFRDRLLWNRDEFVVSPRLVGVSPEELASALTKVQKTVNWETVGLREYLDDVLPAAELDRLLCPVEQFHRLRLQDSLDASFEKLGHYEKKFGPRSARLNFVEAVLNLGLARWSKFGPNEQGWPGPWEAIAAYSTSYVGKDAKELAITSPLEFGLRRYLFAPGWGEKSGLAGQLKPGYYSFGLLVAGDADGPLVEPWQGDQRLGAFVAWGSVKVAYLLTDGDERWLVSKQFQFLPALF